MAAVQLVGAVGDRDDQPLSAPVADQEAQEVTRGGIGPVRVLDDEDERLLGAQPAQQHEQQLEQPALGQGGRGPRWLVTPSSWGSSGARSRTPRRAAQSARQHPPPAAPPPAARTAVPHRRDPRSRPPARAPRRPGAGGELLHEPALAHPRLAADQAKPGSPAAASRVSSSSRASSRARPTNCGLATWTATAQAFHAGRRVGPRARPGQSGHADPAKDCAFEPGGSALRNLAVWGVNFAGCSLL